MQVVPMDFVNATENLESSAITGLETYTHIFIRGFKTLSLIWIGQYQAFESAY